ncbi:MAG: MFS transporter, partial [Acidimicrobiales bacterium]|nr:MFS transporter [Acidimicrobiales bacterium]
MTDPRPDRSDASDDLPLEVIEEAVVDGDRSIRPGTARSALRQRTFRIVFFGAFASNIGTWMQNVVLGAYAFNLTHSSVFVGVIIFAQLGPALVFPMIGGLVADRVNRKLLLIVLSLEQLLFSFVLAWQAREPHPSLVALTLTVLLIGAGSAMFGPAYAALVPTLVGRGDLPGAISLNAAQMNASRVIGPAIGGIVYHLVEPSWIFAGNAVTYVFVIVALLAVSLPSVTPARHSSRWRELTAGITVARADRVVGRCLVTVFLFSLLALAFIGQMPTVAAHNLGINPRSAAYGVLYASFGTGAMAGALSIGTVFARADKARIVRYGLVGYSACLTCFAL